MNNYEMQQNWLQEQTVTTETYKKDLEILHKHLISIERLISRAITIDLQDFILKLENKLQNISTFCLADKELISTINFCKEQLGNFKSLITEDLLKQTEVFANEVELKHSEFIQNIKEQINNITTMSDINKPNVTLTHIERLFYKSFTCYADIIANLAHQSENSNQSTDVENMIQKFSNTSKLAELFLDDQKFIEKCRSQAANYCIPSGEIGILYLQKLIYIATKGKNINLQSQAKFYLSNINNFLINELFQYDADAFKSEIKKLYIYKQLSSRPIAWIGTSNTLMKLLLPDTSLTGKASDPQEVKGIYLNCNETKWSSELNRAWLTTLMQLEYDIKLVETQFTDVKKAIMSNNFPHGIDFLIALLKQTRVIPDIAEDSNITDIFDRNETQYNGGDTPTATSLEILLILAMGYKGHYNFPENNCVLSSPNTPCSFYIGITNNNDNKDTPITTPNTKQSKTTKSSLTPECCKPSTIESIYSKSSSLKSATSTPSKGLNCNMCVAQNSSASARIGFYYQNTGSSTNTPETNEKSVSRKLQFC